LDILPDANSLTSRKLKMLIIGKRPAPVSVKVGHYFQGQQGKSFWSLLDKYDILKVPIGDHEDDHLLGYGYGIIDIVKKPGEKGDEPTDSQYRYGMTRVLNAIKTHNPDILLFVYKKPLTKMLETTSRRDWKLVYGFNENVNSVFNNSKVFICPLPGVGGATKEDIRTSMQALKIGLGKGSNGPGPEPPYDKLVRELEADLSNQEGSQVEFKAGFIQIINGPSDVDKYDITFACLKTIAAFWNTEGGRLYIGVLDDRTIGGLEGDYSRLKKDQNQDGFRRALLDKVDNSFTDGRIISIRLGLNIIKVEEKDVLRIDVPRGDDPAYLIKKNSNSPQIKRTYIRRDNSTQDLTDDVEAWTKYYHIRFKR